MLVIVIAEAMPHSVHAYLFLKNRLYDKEVDTILASYPRLCFCSSYLKNGEFPSL